MPTRPFDPRQVDPSVTDEDIERAIDATPAPFPDVDVQSEIDADTPRSLLIVAASKKQRILNARHLRDDRTFVGVGMCLATIHGPILGLPALYPTAEIAGEHSHPFHKVASPGGAAPRAAIGFAFNNRYGHTWLELGAITIDGRSDALVSSTDYHENGYEGVCLRSKMLAWCGAQSWGWGESVNGFDVWPDPKKPKPAPEPWTWEDRLAQLRRDLDRAKHAHASPRKIDGLQRWIRQVEGRHQ